MFGIIMAYVSYEEDFKKNESTVRHRALQKAVNVRNYAVNLQIII